MKDTLAFFGAFNPPSAAHLGLAEFALKKTGARRVLFVPSRGDYIRNAQGKDFAYGNQRRLEMLRLAARRRPWMAVTDLELRAPSQPRTYDTLCRLRDAGMDAALLLGSDKLPELEKGWLHVREIAREFGFVVLTRGADECARLLRDSPFLSSLSPAPVILETPPETRQVSSTAIRRHVAALKALVPPEILPLLWEGDE